MAVLLISAASRPHGELLSTLDEMGLVRAADVLIAELVARCGHADNIDEALVGVTVRHRDNEVGYTLTIQLGERVRAERSDSQLVVPCRLTFELGDLVPRPVQFASRPVGGDVPCGKAR